MGLNCANPGGCHFPKVPCLASCSFTHDAAPVMPTELQRRMCEQQVDLQKPPWQQAKPGCVDFSPLISRAVGRGWVPQADLDAAVALERERCARILDRAYLDHTSPAVLKALRRCADEIRDVAPD